MESSIHPDETSSPFGERKGRKVPDKRKSLSKAAERERAAGWAAVL